MKACFMVKVIISGKMGENFKEHTKMGLWKVMECIHGKMDKSTKARGTSNYSWRKIDSNTKINTNYFSYSYIYLQLIPTSANYPCDLLAFSIFITNSLSGVDNFCLSRLHYSLCWTISVILRFVNFWDLQKAIFFTTLAVKIIPIPIFFVIVNHIHQILCCHIIV